MAEFKINDKVVLECPKNITPLAEAEYNGCIGYIRLLLARGADNTNTHAIVRVKKNKFNMNAKFTVPLTWLVPYSEREKQIKAKNAIANWLS